jgi:uncharacterized protein YkwD
VPAVTAARRRRLVPRAATLLAALLAPVLAAAAVACEVPAGLPALRAAVVADVNAARRRAGLAPLAADPALVAAAQAHACDIAGRGRLSHRGADGSDVGRRLRREGYDWSQANENVALGPRTPAAAVARWMASPGHRANILARRSREAGAGVALGRDGRPFWVLVTATR